MADLEAIVAAIRDRIDYETAYNEVIKDRWERRGRDEMQALCVFHENTHTPALSINIENGYFHCKNPDCAAEGDIFEFYQRVRAQTFRETVYELARSCGLAHLIPSEKEPALPPLTIDGYVAPDGGVSLDAFAAMAPQVTAASQPPAPFARNGPKKTKVLKLEGPPISMTIVEKYHQVLLGTPSRMAYLAEKRGLNEATIRAFKLGFDGINRFMIPVLDEHGNVRNIRRYRPDAKDIKDKMRSWREGYGSARMFPMDQLRDDEPMFLFEGEMDCLLARQLGLNAYTVTGGAGTWKPEFGDIFVSKRVVICYDNDKAGAKGAKNVAKSLAGLAAEIKIVKIPLAEPKGADFTDYIVGHGMDASDFWELVEHAPTWVDDGTDAPAFDVDPVRLHLSEASEAQYYNAPVIFPAIVSGKTMAPFIVPKEVKVGCPQDVRGTLGPMCERCAVNANNGPVTRTFDPSDNEILQMVNIPQGTLARAVKAMAGVPTKCPFAHHDVIQAMNVESVQLIPEIAFSDKDTPYVTRMAYFLGHGLETNRSYVMQGITVPDPAKQVATHLIHTATAAQSNIDAFALSDDVVKRLEIFQPADDSVEALWVKRDEVYADLEKMTKIYERRDLMLAVDLVYHSALAFAFQGDLLQRGWCEALVIGDSRTGKTTVVHRMMQHYRAGELTSAENTSAVGLIAALHQMGTTWVLQWGKVPLNDRRLLAIDEISGMTTENIGKLSSMRSSGIAEVVKVHTEKTNARTRQIWIGNPRWDRSLSSYSQGVLAVKELIGAPADIARFDLVVTAATDDVALGTVNAPREPEAPTIYTSDLCHQRVMWAWSRKAEQITWAPGASTEVLRLATEHGERYRHATEIPLVEPNEQRVKLARLAVATAMTFFSASPDGEQVIVRPAHVRFAAKFLEQLYAKPSLAFTDYATQQRRLYSIANPDGVRRILARNAMAPQMLMEQTLVTQKDLQEILAYDDLKETRVAISTLRESGFFRRQSTSGYVKTPAAILMLRRIIETGGLSNGNGNGTTPYASAPADDETPSW